MKPCIEKHVLIAGTKYFKQGTLDKPDAKPLTYSKIDTRKIYYLIKWGQM